MTSAGAGNFSRAEPASGELTLAARTGLISDIYAEDLARLFRNLVQQEMWLIEMTALGVSVHIQDLPYAADSATWTLLRQQLGMINEYQAARVGAIFAAVLNQRVAEGQRVGRNFSAWGVALRPCQQRVPAG